MTMETLFWAAAGISALFVVSLAIKKWLPKIINSKFCAICIAVSGTWILLLLGKWFGFFQDDVILALLIGQSITGIFYLVEKNVAEEKTIFRLPLLLTLLVLGYELFRPQIYVGSFITVILLWGIMGVLYALKHNPALNNTVRAMMECCKRW